MLQIRKAVPFMLALLSACGDAVTADIDSLETPAAETVDVIEELHPGFECGVTPLGNYVGPCRLDLGAGETSTLCDETTKKCIAPTRTCVKGWCAIPAASFQSGMSADGLVTAYEADAEITVVPRRFTIQETEVTLHEFQALMGYVPSNSPPCPECPVGGASIFEAMQYANKLSEAAKLEACYTVTDCFETETIPPDRFPTSMCARSSFKGPECRGYRLPSAAEWELAARAGSPNCLWGPPIEFADCRAEGADARALYCANSHVDYDRCYVDADSEAVKCPAGPNPVGSTVPNPFGLYEMHGNVSELTQTACPLSDRLEPSLGPPYPVNHRPEFEFSFTPMIWPCWAGGEWRTVLQLTCASAFRAYDHLNSNGIFYQTSGFRLVQTSFD